MRLHHRRMTMNKVEDNLLYDQLEPLIQIPDEEFKILAEPLLSGLRVALSDSNQRMAIMQEVRKEGMSPLELGNQLTELVTNFDEYFGMLSAVKRDFLKTFFALYINVIQEHLNESETIVNVAIQKLAEDAIIPTYARPGDAGMDIRAIEDVTINPGETKVVKTGIAVAVPIGYELQVRPRSGLSAKTPLRIANTPGTIDSGYRGEIGVALHNSSSAIKDVDQELNPKSVLWGESVTVNKGDRIAQLVLKKVPTCAFYEVDDIKTVPGDRKGGWGSTGK